MNAVARNYYRDSRDPRRNYPTAAKQAHLRLLANLSNAIDPAVNKSQYESIIRRLVPHMVSVLSKNAKNFIDIFEALEKIHFVEIGKYGQLKKILREYDQRYVQIIETTEEEIRMIMHSHNTPKPFPQRKTNKQENSFLSTLSEEERCKWIGKIPYKLGIRILTEEDLENFSEAINPLKLREVRTVFWLSEEELDQIIDSSRGSVSGTCFLILMKWQEKNGGIVTVKELIDRFSEALETDVFSVNFVKVRSALEKIKLEQRNENSNMDSEKK